MKKALFLALALLCLLPMKASGQYNFDYDRYPESYYIPLELTAKGRYLYDGDRRLYDGALIVHLDKEQYERYKEAQRVKYWSNLLLTFGLIDVGLIGTVYAFKKSLDVPMLYLAGAGGICIVASIPMTLYVNKSVARIAYEHNANNPYLSFGTTPSGVGLTLTF